MYIIYLITNLINNKKYVGLTTKLLRIRFARHLYEAKRTNIKNHAPLLAAAIRKYGKENFKIEIIGQGYSDIDELKQAESKFIRGLNTLAPNGYNLKLEEEGKVIVSQETAIKISKSRQGKKTNRNSFSTFIGVSRKRKGFRANITINKKYLYLGTFDTQESAAIAYDIKAIELFGNDCRLNFPDNLDGYLNKNIKLPTTIVKSKRICKPKENNKEKSKLIKVNKIKKIDKLIDKPINKSRKKHKYFGIKKAKNNKWITVYDDRIFYNDLDAAIAYDVLTLEYNNGKILNFPENIEKYKNKEIIPNFYRNRTISKYRGVTFHNNKWLAQICINRRPKHIGYFTTEVDAAMAYNSKVIEIFGDNGKLNIF